MRKQTLVTAGTVVAVFASVLFSVRPGHAIGADDAQSKIMPTTALRGGEKFLQEFLAVISNDSIKAGQSAVVTLSGGPPDVSATTDVPLDWKKLASVTWIDKISYSVKGLAPGEAMITFRKGDKRAAVKVTVVVGGLNQSSTCISSSTGETR